MRVGSVPFALTAALTIACCTACGQTPQAPVVRISGLLVFDSTGGPVQYEAVHLRLPGTENFLATVPTDSSGRFTLVVQPKKYELVVHVPYSRALVQAVNASDGRDVDAGLLRIRYVSLCDQVQMGVPQRDPKYPVSGRVVEASGKPVENAIVAFADACQGAETKTGRDGRFRIRLQSSGYVLEIKGPGFLPIVRFDIRTGERGKKADLGTFVVDR